MKNFAKVMVAFAVLGFTTLASAYDKENKTETSTTFTGKKKVKHTRKTENADGTVTTSTTETITPRNTDHTKNKDTMDTHRDIHRDTTLDDTRDSHPVNKDVKTTKKVERSDGTTIEENTETKPNK